MPVNLKHKGTGIHRNEGLDSSETRYWNYSNSLFQFLSPQERRKELEREKEETSETRYWKEWEFQRLSPQKRRKKLERKKEGIKTKL